MIRLRAPALAVVPLLLWLPQAVAAVDVRCGETVRRALDRPEQVDAPTFAGHAGEVVSITVVAAALEGKLADVRWTVVGPGDTTVPTSTGDDLCGGECETRPLPADATYAVHVLDPTRDGTGGYFLTLEAVSATADGVSNGPPSPVCARLRLGAADGTQPLVRGPAIAGAIDVEGETDTFTVTATHGETLHATIIRTDTNRRPPFAPEWALFDPDGVRVPTADGNATCGGSCDTQPLPRDGTYTFLVRDVGHDAPGEYAFTVDAPPPTTTTTSTSTTSTLPRPLALALTIASPPPAPAGVGATVAIGPGRLIVGAPGAGAVHVVDVTGGAADGRLVDTLSAGAPGDRFGVAVAASAGIVVGGAPGDDGAGPDAGAAWAFGVPGRSGPLRIAPPDAATGGAFGAAVTAAGDSVLVGAPGAGQAFRLDPATGAVLARFPGTGAPAGFGTALAAGGGTVVGGAPGSAAAPGAALLFDDTGTPLRTLTSPLPAPGDAFGAAVAIAGPQVVVAAPGGAGGGAVHVFDAATGTLVRTIASPTRHDGDGFGTALAASDAGLVVGAPGAGVVYVIGLADGAVVSTLASPHGGRDARFGASVAWLGDQIFVGAPGDEGGTGTGWVFAGGDVVAVLRRRLGDGASGSALVAAGPDIVIGAPGAGTVRRVDGTTGATLATIAAPAGAQRFGFAVAAVDASIVAGAPGGGNEAGAAWVVTGSATPVVLQDPQALPGTQTGWSLATAGTDIAVGAPLAGAADTGTVQVFDVTTGVRRATFRKPTPTAGDFFGAAVAADGNELLVGAPLDGAAGVHAGAAYLFRTDSAVIERVLASPTPARGELFGAAVAFAGSHVVVAAPLADAGAPRAGAVHVFDRTTGAYVRTLRAPLAHADDQFGHTVAALGDAILVGAPLADGSRPDTGVAYLFDGVTGALRQTLPDPAQGAFDHFGVALALGPSAIVVGAPGPGRVYVFRGTALGTLRPAASEPACGDGVVEPGEACDDGNDDDIDDCRRDCTLRPCCTLDPPPAPCDDGDPCTDDILDPATGCRHPANGSCCSDDGACGTGACRACDGCFLHPWACCATGAACLATAPDCAGRACVASASCRCEGGLACAGETTPALAARLFAGACDQLRLEESGASTGGGALRATRRRLRHARELTRKAVAATRRAVKRGSISRACGGALLAQLKDMKGAIPGGKQVRRCAEAR